MKKWIYFIFCIFVYTFCSPAQQRLTAIPSEELEIMEKARQEHKLDIVGTFNDGMAIVGKDGKFGFIDMEGNMVFPIQYRRVTPFIEGMSVNRETEYLLDKQGNNAVSTSGYLQIGIISEGRIRVMDHTYQYGFIDLEGDLVIPSEYENAEPFSEGLALVATGIYPDLKYGYIDKNGKVVIPMEYQRGGSFSDGVAWVQKGQEWGLIDKTGQFVVPLGKFSPASYKAPEYPISVKEGLIGVSKGSKSGFIDKTGKIIIPIQFDKVKSFSEGLAPVFKNGKYGYIDKKGQLVIPYKYEFAADFVDGLAWVGKTYDHVGRIDKNGYLVDDFVFSRYENTLEGGGIFKVWTKDGIGFIDMSGHIMLEKR